MMYVFEYFVYHLKPFGTNTNLVLPKSAMGEVPQPDQTVGGVPPVLQPDQTVGGVPPAFGEVPYNQHAASYTTLKRPVKWRSTPALPTKASPTPRVSLVQSVANRKTVERENNNNAVVVDQWEPVKEEAVKEEGQLDNTVFNDNQRLPNELPSEQLEEQERLQREATLLQNHQAALQQTHKHFQDQMFRKPNVKINHKQKLNDNVNSLSEKIRSHVRV